MQMRDHIVSEIRRIAASNGGQAPGSQAFQSATGIGESKWRGKYWARWGDALIAAGFQPNEWYSRTDSEVLLQGVISACRHYRRFPTGSEISVLRQADPSIPAPKVIRSTFGNRDGLIAALAERLRSDDNYADVFAMLPIVAPSRQAVQSGTKSSDGHVYLLRSGDFYKIGRSDELERRVKEIRVALPDTTTLIHSIATDDPPGIEAYWHRRFSDRRANGEWFRLTPEDVKAFLRRKFQ